MGAFQQQKGLFWEHPHLSAKPNQKERSIAFAETLYHTGTVVFIDTFRCNECVPR